MFHLFIDFLQALLDRFRLWDVIKICVTCRLFNLIVFEACRIDRALWRFGTELTIFAIGLLLDAEAGPFQRPSLAEWLLLLGSGRVKRVGRVNVFNYLDDVVIDVIEIILFVVITLV